VLSHSATCWRRRPALFGSSNVKRKHALYVTQPQYVFVKRHLKNRAPGCLLQLRGAGYPPPPPQQQQQQQQQQRATEEPAHRGCWCWLTTTRALCYQKHTHTHTRARAQGLLTRRNSSYVTVIYLFLSINRRQITQLAQLTGCQSRGASSSWTRPRWAWAVTSRYLFVSSRANALAPNANDNVKVDTNT